MNEDQAPLLDESERVRLAANNTASPIALRNLANDPAVTVRAAVAMNISAGGSLFAVLANDPDDRVRALLGRRLATLLPTLSAEDRAQLRDHAVGTLLALVNDEAERVRLAIADVVKDMPGVPPALIQRLARDISIAVAEPVIRLSPVLTDQDLMALVASPPTPASVIAVARRPGLAALVATSIAECGNNDAIGALLGNRSAAISEPTSSAAPAYPHMPPRHWPRSSQDKCCRNSPNAPIYPPNSPMIWHAGLSRAWWPQMQARIVIRRRWNRPTAQRAKWPSPANSPKTP